MVVIKKIWVIVALLLGALLSGGWYFFFDAAVNGLPPQYIMQTITADSKTSRTITWQTEWSEELQMVAYHANNVAELQFVEVWPKLLTTGAEAMALYSVKLENLQPETEYCYKVGGKNNWSGWHKFHTESKVAAVKALIFGDSQSSDYGVWRQTAQNAWHNNPDAQFFINMGDLVDIGSHYDQWKAWFNGAPDMLTAIPAATISGNHENYLPGGTLSPAQLYLELFNLPDNGPENCKRQAYSFDYGGVHFIALDSQEEELAAFQPDLIDSQMAWLAMDLQQTSQPWKVLMIHRPLFKNAKSGELSELGKRLVPLFDRYQVDVVFTAHIHTYGRTEPLVDQKISAKLGKGTIYISTGRSGDKTWDGSKQKYFEVIFDRCLDQPNYLLLESTAERMKITNFKQDGTLVDMVALSK